ncbi:sensor histidine kinase [Dinghuibacter silviterrae]|uniref:Histidine kinase n=1 Tax=Dinghuibacter silviterrae TaxID=1539049 RepID=A0A4R8DGC1_9BACT|nr:histidine kinase [Dinghuibacter silviterrae]TDW96418.1 histidine kinase [Dinghuibacter silviterrae]
MRKQLPLGLLFSLLVPALNLVNNDVIRKGIDYRKVLFSWGVGFILLLFTWMVNQVLRDRGVKGWVYIPVNAVLVLGMQPLLAWLGPYRVGGEIPQVFIAVRLVMAVILVLLVQSSLKAREKEKALALHNQQLLNENLKARLDALREQVNPHFLFNSLGTLRSMVRPDNPAAEQFILHLSDVYRQLLNRKEGVTVPLSEELDFLHSYLYMLEARFEGAFTVSVQVPEASLDGRVPSFCLQMLVENCIKHNVVSAEYPLRVQIHVDGDGRLVVSNRRSPKGATWASEAAAWAAANTGGAATAGLSTGGVGLVNLRKRYEWLGVDNGVRITETADTFEVSLTFVPS